MAHVAPCLSYMDLFTLVKTTKEMRSRLTHEHALTAVLLNADDKFGKNAKSTIRNVMDLYEKGKSTSRRPCASCAWRTASDGEFGPPCDTPEARKVVKTRPDWGLFCCWPHTVGGSHELSLSKKSLKTWGATIGDPRTCQHSMSNKTFLWKKPHSRRRREDWAHYYGYRQHDGHARRRARGPVPAPRSRGPRARERRFGRESRRATEEEGLEGAEGRRDRRSDRAARGRRPGRRRLPSATRAARPAVPRAVQGHALEAQGDRRRRAGRLCCGGRGARGFFVPRREQPTRRRAEEGAHYARLPRARG